MTCDYSNFNMHDAVYNLVRAFPGGVEAMAQRMGMSTNVLRNKTRPAIETHHTNFEEVSVIIEMAEESKVPTAFVPLHAFCWRHNHVAIKMPTVEANAEDLIKQLVEVMSDEGKLATTVSESLGDQRIDRHDLDEIELIIDESIGALVMLREKARSKFAMDNTRK